MTLEALGNLGEAIGATAVVLSLIYLVIQLKQTTQSVRSATYQSIVATAASCNQTISQNKELARILRLGSLDVENLDEDERVQFSFLCMQFIDIFENLYLQYVHGTLDDDYWIPRSKAFLELFGSPGFLESWSQCRINYSESFRSFVEAGLASPDEGDGDRRLGILLGRKPVPETPTGSRPS